MRTDIENWLFIRARKVDPDIEVQDLYTGKFCFGGAWVMDLIDEYHKEHSK